MVMEVDLCRFRCLWSLFIHCSVDFGDEVLSEDVNVYVEDEDEREYFIEVRWTMNLFRGRSKRWFVVGRDFASLPMFLRSTKISASSVEPDLMMV